MNFETEAEPLTIFGEAHDPHLFRAFAGADATAHSRTPRTALNSESVCTRRRYVCAGVSSRPAALDELGAEAAIRDLAARTRHRGLGVELAIDLAYEHGRRTDRYPTELETAMYRIIQEALNNTHKHGRAQRALVQIEEDDHSVCVTVRDDGRGFDAQVKTNGFGLIGMHERAQLAGGTVEIQTSPGDGTTVTARLPTQRPTQRAISV